MSEQSFFQLKTQTDLMTYGGSHRPKYVTHKINLRESRWPPTPRLSFVWDAYRSCRHPCIVNYARLRHFFMRCAGPTRTSPHCGLLRCPARPGGVHSAPVPPIAVVAPLFPFLPASAASACAQCPPHPTRRPQIGRNIEARTTHIIRVSGRSTTPDRCRTRRL